MGQAASFVNSQLEQQNTEKKKNMDDALQGLKATADAKIALFYEKIEAGEDSKLIPINRILSKFQFVQCKVSQDSNQLKSEIGGLIGDIAGGKWADAITDVASAAINGMLGSSAAGITERSTYCISMDPLGGVSRLDAFYMAYTFTAQGLIEDCQNFVACCVVKSSVDMKSLDDDSLRIIVNDSFAGLTSAQKAGLLEQVQIALLPEPPTEKQVAGTKALAAFWEATMKITDGKTNQPPAANQPPAITDGKVNPLPAGNDGKATHPPATNDGKTSNDGKDGKPPAVDPGKAVIPGQNEGPRMAMGNIPYVTIWRFATFNSTIAQTFIYALNAAFAPAKSFWSMNAIVPDGADYVQVTLRAAGILQKAFNGAAAQWTLQSIVDDYNTSDKSEPRARALWAHLSREWIVVDDQIITGPPRGQNDSDGKKWAAWLGPASKDAPDVDDGKESQPPAVDPGKAVVPGQHEGPRMVMGDVPYITTWRFNTFTAVAPNSLIAALNAAFPPANNTYSVVTNIAGGANDGYVQVTMRATGQAERAAGGAAAQLRLQATVDDYNFFPQPRPNAEWAHMSREWILVQGQIVTGPPNGQNDPNGSKWATWWSA